MFIFYWKQMQKKQNSGLAHGKQQLNSPLTCSCCMKLSFIKGVDKSVELHNFLMFFFIIALIVKLARHGQFPVSMETERVSAESHDLNSIEKVHQFSHMRTEG